MEIDSASVKKENKTNRYIKEKKSGIRSSSAA